MNKINEEQLKALLSKMIGKTIFVNLNSDHICNIYINKFSYIADSEEIIFFYEDQETQALRFFVDDIQKILADVEDYEVNITILLKDTAIRIDCEC